MRLVHHHHAVLAEKEVLLGLPECQRRGVGMWICCVLKTLDIKGIVVVTCLSVAAMPPLP